MDLNRLTNDFSADLTGCFTKKRFDSGMSLDFFCLMSYFTAKLIDSDEGLNT